MRHRAAGPLGARIEAVHTRRDHHVFTDTELSNLRRDILWVTTAKDFVCLAGRLPAAVLELELAWPRGPEPLRAKVLQAAAAAPAGASAP